MPCHVSGSLVAIQFASHSAWNAATVSRTPSAPEGETHDPADRLEPLGPALVEPDHRRSERRAAVVGHDDRPALGREADAGDRLALDQAARPQPAQASPIERQYSSASCSAQPGCGETYASIGTREAAISVPRGSKTSARTLCVPTSMART